MRRCDACGSTVGQSEENCPACGITLDGATASFAPVGTVAEPADTLTGFEGPVLVVRKGPETGETFYLDRPTLTIGRDPGSDIFLNDVTVSRKHAEVAVSSAEVIVRDAGSLNGTYVNDVRVDEAPLSDGDVVRIGRFQMVFVGGGGL